MKQHKSKVISLILVLTLLVCAVPLNASAASIADETATANRFNIAVSDDSPEYVREIAEKSQLYDEFEVVSLREENVKHFALADGTLRAEVYVYPVHELNELGQWEDIVATKSNELDDDNESSLLSLDSLEGMDRTQYSYRTYADTYISSYSPTTNHSTEEDLYVASNMIAYMRFSNPSLPSNAYINSAYLTVYYSYFTNVTDGYVSTGVYRVKNYWNAPTLTWNSSGSDHGLVSTPCTVEDLEAFQGSQHVPFIFDVTDIALDWSNGSSNYGIALQRVGGTNSSVIIDSLEYATYAAPLYTINYTLVNLPVDNGTYFLYNIQLERYLQIDPDASVSNQAYMELWTFDGDIDQKWEITYLHNGYYKIRSKYSGLYLAIKSGSENTSSGRVVQEVYTSDARQQWAFSITQNGYIVIRPRSGESYSTDWAMSAAWGIWNGDGREVVQRAYSNDNDLKDKWILYKIIYNYNYVHYYDSTLVGDTSLINNIKLATSFSSLAYLHLCGLTFSMAGPATQFTSAIADQCPHSSNVPCSITDCGSNCSSQHHRNCFNISNQLYNNGLEIENGYRYVMWSNRSYGTYCNANNGMHETVNWIAVVYNSRPVIHFLTINGTTNVKKACMTLNLVHETAHTFGMPDVYDISGHDVTGATVCVMERFDSATAYAFYTSVLDGTCDAFCGTCAAMLRSKILDELEELLP